MYPPRLVPTPSALKREAKWLKREAKWLKKYTETLEEKVKEITKLQDGIQKLETQIVQMKKENEEIEKRLNSLETNLKEASKKENETTKKENEEKRLNNLETNLKKLQNAEQTRRAKLLMGSVAYNFMDRVIEYVFGKKEMKDLRRSLTSLEDVQKAVALDDNLQQKWDLCLKTFRIDVEGMDNLMKLKNALHHPTRITEEDEEDKDCPPPTSDQLKELAHRVFKNRSKARLVVAQQIIDSLHALSFQLHKNILE